MNSQPFEMPSCKVGLVDDCWGMRFDPLTISRSARDLVLVRKVVVMLSNISLGGRVNLQKARHTSSLSGVSCLYSALASFARPDKLGDLAAFNFSVKNTAHVVVPPKWGGLRAVDLSCFLVKADFCPSVNTLGFLSLGLGLGFAFAAFFFFAGFGFGLIRGFTFDLAFGTAFGVVFLGAGFLAAFVFEVVGAFFAAVVVLPVWALGRDTARCA